MNKWVAAKTMHALCHHKKWLNDFQTHQLNQFIQNGFPSRKNEWWKYTEIQESHIPENAGIFHELSEKEIPALDVSRISVVFINGHFSEKLSQLNDLPSTVKLSTLQKTLRTNEERIKPYLVREWNDAQFPFARLNSALMTDGMFLDIPKNAVITMPIHLIFIHTQQNEFTTSPRNIILAGKHSQVTLVEHHIASHSDHYFKNAVTDIHADENAQIDYYKIQNEALTSTHIAALFIEQQKMSRVNVFSFSRGSRLAREDVCVWQKADAAETHLHGLYTLHHDQHHVDHHIHVEHSASHGVSSMRYKGILDKKSRAVFNGKVYVHPDTAHIQANQTNHNLLLSDRAEVNTKPELEIYADDVKCTHGATVGQLNDEALFYLLSRGIEKKEARNLLIRAFMEEVYSKIENGFVKEYIQKWMCHDDE